MGLSEDIARLILELDNKQFQQAGASAVTLMGELSAAFGRGEITVAEFDSVLTHLGTDLGPVANQIFAAEGALEEFKRGGMAAAEAASKVSKGVQETGKGSGTLRQSIQATSFALQDFASAGGGVFQKLQSISNNIPGILVGLGSAGAGISAAFSIGVAVVQNWDTLIRIFQTKFPFERAAHDVEAMKRELEAANENMKKLEQNTSMTADELAKYNKLRERTAQLEKEISTETERQQEIERARKEVTEEQEARAKAIQEATKGYHDQDVKNLRERLEAQRRLNQAEDLATARRKIQAKTEEGGPLEDLNRYAAEVMGEHQHRVEVQNREDMGAAAEELYRKARRGEQDAIDRIRKLTEPAPGGQAYGLGARIRQPTREEAERRRREEEEATRGMEQDYKQAVAEEAARPETAESRGRIAAVIKDQLAAGKAGAEVQEIITGPFAEGLSKLLEVNMGVARGVAEKVVDEELKKAIGAQATAQAREAEGLATGKFTPGQEATFAQFQEEQFGGYIPPARGQARPVDEGALEAARMRQEEREARAAPGEARQANLDELAGGLQQMSGGMLSQGQALAGARNAARMIEAGVRPGEALAAALDGLTANLNNIYARMQRTEMQLMQHARAFSAMRSRQPSGQFEGGFGF